MNPRMEDAFAVAQYKVHAMMRSDPGTWHDALRRALKGISSLKPGYTLEPAQ